MNIADSIQVLERQLLLQLGERLKRLRAARGVNTTDMARTVGISRTTLAAIEAGDPGCSMGTYLRVMGVLGIAGDLALLAGDALGPAPAGSAGARSRRPRPVVEVKVSADESRHQVQDVQSLALHDAAVALARRDPDMVQAALGTLERWLSAGNSRSADLWHEWQDVLRHGKWKRVTARTRRGQELRQASPLTPLLPQAQRESVLAQVRDLKKGLQLGMPPAGEAAHD